MPKRETRKTRTTKWRKKLRAQFIQKLKLQEKGACVSVHLVIPKEEQNSRNTPQVRLARLSPAGSCDTLLCHFTVSQFISTIFPGLHPGIGKNQKGKYLSSQFHTNSAPATTTAYSTDNSKRSLEAYTFYTSFYYYQFVICCNRPIEFLIKYVLFSFLIHVRSLSFGSFSNSLWYFH